MYLQAFILGFSILAVGSNVSIIHSVGVQTKKLTIETNNGPTMENSMNTLMKDKSNLASTNIHSPQQTKKMIGERSIEVIQAIKNKDMKKLKEFVHPEKGVRFSPYTYVDTKSDLLFTPAQLEKLPSDNTIFIWGKYDGTGEPIKLTFNQYYDKFIYDRDFANAERISYNKMIEKGNTINNIRKIYPNSIVMDYYFDGSKQYSGMDWKSLRLVYEKIDTQWYLVGIVHNQWTI